MTIQMIALNKLVPSAVNVRKTGVATGIEQLAASIEAHGLLQNLQVQLSDKGKFEVVAGGRRLAALKLLAKRKSLPKDFEVPCRLLDSEDGTEISLAENTIRLNMHPADQFAAFYALSEGGKGVEEIAARFGVAVSTVLQRLKLAAVSPILMELYRADDISLDQMMAFTVSDSHEAQEAAWFEQPPYNRSASAIRRTLTAAHVGADNRRVALVGIDAYQAAGGVILRDLFDTESGGYLTNPALLDRLVNERLEAEATAVRAEGWKWVEIMPDFDYATRQSFGRIHPVRVPLDDDQQRELDQLSEEYDELIESHGDEPEEEIAERIESLSEHIDLLTNTATSWAAADLALAGAIVSVGPDGKAEIARGLVRKEDQKAASLRSQEATAGTTTGIGLSAGLIEVLTAERTAALRAIMKDNQHVALAAVAHVMALPVFYPDDREVTSCLDLRLKNFDLRMSVDAIGETRAGVFLQQAHDGWVVRLPKAPAELFGWLIAADMATVTELLAYCAAMSLDAVRGKQDQATTPRLRHADELAHVVDLDMAEWWSPTAGRYLGRVSKSLILEAVTEGVSQQAAENFIKLKKAELVSAAETRLTGSKWLPAIFRQTSATTEAEARLEAAE